MSIKVKICGIKTKTAALASVKYGADFLGFNFVFSSKRKIGLYSAKKIILSLRGLNASEGRGNLSNRPPMMVAVFMNQPADFVNQILSQIKFDMLQFHGKESPKFCASFKLPFIKVFTVNKKDTVASLAKKMKKYTAKYFLLDRQDRKSGLIINLKTVSKLAEKFPVLLAGGLTPQNIKDCVSRSGPIKGVDVAGGVEKARHKDTEKINLFIHNVIIQAQ